MSGWPRVRGGYGVRAHQAAVAGRCTTCASLPSLFRSSSFAPHRLGVGSSGTSYCGPHKGAAALSSYDRCLAVLVVEVPLASNAHPTAGGAGATLCACGGCRVCSGGHWRPPEATLWLRPMVKAVVVCTGVEVWS